MTFNHKLENEILTVYPVGRLDTDSSVKFETEILDICNANKHESLILDATELQYVASSGLRVILKIAKSEKNFKIENVSSAIYSVFEMTGFSRIINISKALRKIDLEKCERIGFGGNGAVYRVSEDEIVKVNYNPDTYGGLEKELTKAKEAFLLGVPTAISFDLVDCGDGKRGVVYETIKSTTLGEAMHSDPSRMEELTDRYVEQRNALHSIRTDNPVFGSAKDNFRKQVEDSSKYLTEEEGKLLHLVLDALPEGDRLVHCDAHPKNLMIQNGEMLWIDMEQMAVGHPIYDLISIAVILDGMRTEEMIMNIAGMSNANVALLKECFLRKYFNTEDKEMLEKLSSMLGALRLIRTVFAIGFKTPQNEKYRQAIIDMARKVFFPNIQNIVAGVKSLLSVVD